MCNPRQRSLFVLVGVLASALGWSPASAQQLEEDAEHLYSVYCGVCHQADGQGVERAFPPLAGSRFLLENPTRTIDIILHGVEGPIRVDRFYEGAMAPVGYLSDQEVVAIMNYILNTWGNDGGNVTVDEVRERREVGEPVRFEPRDR